MMANCAAMNSTNNETRCHRCANTSAGSTHRSEVWQRKRRKANLKNMFFKNLPWFRMYSDAVNDEKLRLLAFEDRWHFVALLCCKSKGVLDDSNGDMLMRKAAVLLGLSTRELSEVARRLSEVGLIDFDTLQPIKWDDRQFRSDSSTERVHAYRDRIRNTAKRDCNVSETAQDTDTDTDTDKTSHKNVAGVSDVFRNGKWIEVETGEVQHG